MSQLCSSGVNAKYQNDFYRNKSKGFSTITMRYNYIHIENYKSLKDIHFEPSQLTAVIGPNAAGKSNLASAFEFISDAYQDGLGIAVARKGGYENIAFRRQRRTKSAITFELQIELDRQEVRSFFRYMSRKFRNSPPAGIRTATVTHNFSLRAKGQGIRSEFILESEIIHFDHKTDANLFTSTSNEFAFSLLRSNGKIKITRMPSNQHMREEIDEFIKYFERFEFNKVGSDESFALKQLLPQIARIPARTAVYQFSPKICRLPAAPAPEPRLSGYGENLPALIDWLKRHHPNIWKEIINSMRDIIPGLEDITVEYLHTKTLGLFFKEEGFSRPWTAEDVSDGTLQALAVLAAISDPRSSALIVEEPENSVHPWITKLLVRRMREISKSRPVIVTTHSPMIIDLVRPSEIWVAYKKDGHTELNQLTALNPDIEKDWENGKYRIFEFLETGAVPQVVPGF